MGDFTGGGYYGGAAVVLPRETGPTGDLIMQLQQQAYQREQQKLRQEQLDQARADSLAKYVGEEFKDKNFATGTAADPAINGLVGAAKTKYASIIKANPNIPMSDLVAMMSKDISEINQWSSTVKTKNEDIEAAVKALSGYKNIDAPGVRSVAMSNFLFKTDPKTGKKVLKSPAELDMQSDYVSDVLSNNPELVLRSGYSPDIAEMVKKMPTSRQDNVVTTDDNGIKREKGYKAELYPFQEVKADAKGIPYVAMKSDPSSGLPEIADDSTYAMFNDLENQTWLNAEVKKMGISPSSKEGELAKRHLVYGLVKGIQPKEFSPVDKTNEDVWLAKYQAGVLGNALSANLKALRDELMGKGFDDTDLLLQGLSGRDANIVSIAPTVDIDGKQYKDISALAQNNLIATMKGGKKVYNQVLLDPDNPGTAIVYDISDIDQKRVESSKKVLQGKELIDYISRNAPFNGSNVKKAMYKMRDYFDKDLNMVTTPVPEGAKPTNPGKMAGMAPKWMAIFGGTGGGKQATKKPTSTAPKQSAGKKKKITW
jgi:hypothetical protein